MQNIYNIKDARYMQYKYSFLHKVFYKRLMSVQMVFVQTVKEARCQIKNMRYII